jgi:Asp-tRNA(Asn)/Glu-tRNA(Gln) amidotransferase A subunit family amidase
MTSNYNTLIKNIVEARGNKNLIFKNYEIFIDKFNKLNDKYKFSVSLSIDYIFKQLEEIVNSKPRTLNYIPFGIKDTFNTKVLPTQMGSEIWKGFKAGNNARIVDEITFRGGLSFCKTSTAEFAVNYIEAGYTLNPHNIEHITGTSSAGSAVAIACGALPICLGSQTAGSIIRPASFCGVFGFKPSFGAFDRTGILKTTDTLDTIGLLGCDMDVILKAFLELYQSSKDYPLSQKYKKNYIDKINRKPNILLLGGQLNVFNSFESYVQKDFESISHELASKYNVIQVKDKEINFLNNVHQSHKIIYDKALSYYFLEESKLNEKISVVMSEMIDRGSKFSDRDYVNQIKIQRESTIRFDEVMNKYNIDYIVTPSTGSVAPKIGKNEILDSCLIWTYLGMPSVSIPAFYNNDFGLPYGLQIISPRYDDLLLLSFSKDLYELLKQ